MLVSDVDSHLIVSLKEKMYGTPRPEERLAFFGSVRGRQRLISTRQHCCDRWTTLSSPHLERKAFTRYSMVSLHLYAPYLI